MPRRSYKTEEIVAEPTVHPRSVAQDFSQGLAVQSVADLVECIGFGSCTSVKEGVEASVANTPSASLAARRLLTPRLMRGSGRGGDSARLGPRSS